MLKILLKILLCNHLIKCALSHQYDIKGWQSAAEWLAKSINESADPCEDFFDFACGKFSENYPSFFTDERDAAQFNLIRTLQEALNNINIESAKTEEFKKSMKIFYDQCEKQPPYIFYGNKDIFKLVQQLYENMVEYLLPHLEETPNNIDNNNTIYPWENGTSSFQFWNFVGMMQRVLGTPFLIEAEVLLATVVDGCANVPSLYLRAAIFQPISGRDDDAVFDFLMNFVLKYHNYTADEKEINDTKKEMTSFYLNWYLLVANTSAQVSYSIVDYRNVRPVRFNDLSKEISTVNWDGYFHGLLPEDIRNTFLKSNPFIRIEFEDYHREINSIVEKFGYITATNLGFMLALKQYTDFVVYGAQKIHDRRGKWQWKFSGERCLDTVVKYFSAASIRLLAEEIKIDIENWRNDFSLIKNLVFSSFIYQIYSTDYLSPEEKMVLINKTNNIQFYGDIPSWITDDNQVNKRTPKYDGKSSLVANQILAQKELFLQEMQPLISGRMDDAPPMLMQNAFNDVRELGNIRFMLGFQLPPFFSYSYPLVAKFGGVGYVMGHELMHSFGTHLYRNTSFADVLPLRNSTFDIVREKVECLIPHFNEYCRSEPSLFKGGKPHESCKYGYYNQEENTADAEAIKIAYNAYKFATQTFGDEPVLTQYPELTNDQLFFVFYAKQWCTKGSHNFVEGLKHAAAKARIEQPLMNFPSFATSFNCKRGQKYNREQRCNLYGSGVQ